MKLESFKPIKNKSEKFNFDEEILKNYPPEQAGIIRDKQKILSAIAGFIGKDFSMPVYLNNPNAGWHWNFKDNYIRIDPQDILEKPMDYLRFVIAHEGGHRRVSRTEFIPDEILQTPGFLSMMNAIEDPRMNNFVAESYPVFKNQMVFSYTLDKEGHEKVLYSQKEKLGFVPRHELAGLEYINQWFREVQGQEFQIDERLPDDVKNVVQKTLHNASVSWKLYPTKPEADGREFYNFKGKQITGEEIITEFAKKSYEINLEKVWPVYKTLLEKDKKDAELNQLLEDLKKELEQSSESQQKIDNKEQEGDDSSQEGGQKLQQILDKLSESEQNALIEQLKESIEKGNSVPLDTLSESLKEKIQQMIDQLPQDVKQDIQERAQERLSESSREFAQSLQSHMETERQKSEISDESEVESNDSQEYDQNPEYSTGKESKKTQLTESMNPEELASIQKAQSDIRNATEHMIHNPENRYMKTMQEVLPIINQLEDDLREIFTERRSRGWQKGYKTGRKIDIARRIQEKAKDVNVFESLAWKKREAPTEQDYAITLLVDLSGSMNGQKIKETFKSVVVLSEVLNKLSLNVEILGFNDRIHVYQEYGKDMNDNIRDTMSEMIDETDSNTSKGNPRYNDDGYALIESSDRLQKQDAKQKFLLVLSDGLPEESPRHSGSQYRLDKVIKHITDESDQKLIGLGIGHGTEHVKSYYPNSIANISTQQMSEKISDLLRDIIINYDEY